jgi:hypothetical protein
MSGMRLGGRVDEDDSLLWEEGLKRAGRVLVVLLRFVGVEMVVMGGLLRLEGVEVGVGVEVEDEVRAEVRWR